MSGDQSAEDRNRLPDVVPEDLVEEYGDDARFTVLASRVELGHGFRRRLGAMGRDLAEWSSSIQWPGLLVTLGLFATLAWLTKAPDSALVMLLAAGLVVAAVLVVLRWSWHTLRAATARTRASETSASSDD